MYEWNSFIIFFIQGLWARQRHFVVKRFRPIRGRSPEDEQRTSHHVAGSAEWMVSIQMATRGGCQRLKLNSSSIK